MVAPRDAAGAFAVPGVGRSDGRSYTLAMPAVNADASPERSLDSRATGRSALAATAGRWFGPPGRPLLGWLSTPGGAATASGVLVLPAVGYPYWSSHRTLRVLAERLACEGHTVLRFDYDGTGDSSGDQWDADRVAAWRSSVVAGARELRELGCHRVLLVGVRLGGLFALLDGSALGADALVAWEPVTSGRRYAKEIRLLSTAVPEADRSRPAGTLVSAGVVFMAQTIEQLSALALADVAAAPARRILVVGERENTEIVEHLRGLGADAEYRVLDGTQALELPAEDAMVPAAVVEAICDWIGPQAAAPTLVPSERRSAQVISTGGGVTEEVVTLGAAGLVGVISETGALPPDALTVVFLSSGSEPHIGSGRAWVEYARALAGFGYRSVRVDFRGWGESPDDGLAPGRPYDPHCEQDTIAIVAALRERGHDHVALVGLCAGAWVALRAVRHERVAGVIALNPQLYWQPGDPVEALMSDTRVRRTAEREREQLGARFGAWTALDVLGARSWAARWLDDLVRGGVPVSMLFAQGDDGLEYLRNRVGRRLAAARRSGVVRVVELPEVDHSMHRVWLRGHVVAELREQLEWFRRD
jgi:pimeloyl-ACP methyl ester carboxylesterase